jgi:excisionase family DNA binding protein
MERILTINEFCQRYKLGRTKTYGEIAEGRLKSVRVGAKRLIRADDAEAWAASLSDDSGEKAA